MKNNKGLAPIFIILSLLLIIGLITSAYFLYSKKINADDSSKYYSFNFVKFKLPKLDQNKIAEFLKNPKNAKCYHKEYFKEATFNNFYISIYTFPEIEDLLCDGTEENPIPYKGISLFYINDFQKSVFNDNERNTWKKDDELSNINLDVYRNISQFSYDNRETKYYFRITNKNSQKDEAVILGLNPVNEQTSLEFDYMLRLIKVMELKLDTEFTGLSNCRINECKNLEVNFEDETLGYKPDTYYVVRNYKIKLTDSASGNSYYKYVLSNRNFDTESEIRKISKFKNYLIFSFTVNNIKNLNDAKLMYKIAILDLKSGEIKDIVTNPENVQLQDFLVNGDDLVYVTGDTCAEVDPCDSKKYFYKYNFQTNKVAQLTTKSLTELGIKGEDMSKVNLLKVENNKILFSVMSVLQPLYTYAEYDLGTDKINIISADQTFETNDLKLAKEKELGVTNFEKLMIINGEVVQK
jgi:hypothetical protein